MEMVIPKDKLPTTLDGKISQLSSWKGAVTTTDGVKNEEGRQEAINAHHFNKDTCVCWPLLRIAIMSYVSFFLQKMTP